MYTELIEQTGAEGAFENLQVLNRLLIEKNARWPSDHRKTLVGATIMMEFDRRRGCIGEVDAHGCLRRRRRLRPAR